MRETRPDSLISDRIITLIRDPPAHSQSATCNPSTNHIMVRRLKDPGLLDALHQACYSTRPGSSHWARGLNTPTGKTLSLHATYAVAPSHPYPTPHPAPSCAVRHTSLGDYLCRRGLFFGHQWGSHHLGQGHCPECYYIPRPPRHRDQQPLLQPVCPAHSGGIDVAYWLYHWGVPRVD